MTGRGPESYEQALRAVSALLAVLPGRAMLIGGVAVIAHGHVRTTDDIDVTTSGRGVTPGQILSLAAPYDIQPRIHDAAAFAQRTQVLLLVHRPSGVTIDLSLAWLPFEEEALERQMLVRLRDIDLRVCDPEDLIVYKLVAARPIDLEDARQLAMRHHARIDRERVRRILAEFDSVLADDRPRIELWETIERSAYPEA